MCNSFDANDLDWNIQTYDQLQAHEKDKGSRLGQQFKWISYYAYTSYHTRPTCGI